MRLVVELQCKPISYQIEGICTAKWGSSAKIGLPVAVRLPERTQLLEPTPTPVAPRISYIALTLLAIDFNSGVISLRAIKLGKFVSS